MFDQFYAYKFIRLLTKPYTDLPAFQLGLIDVSGNKLKRAETLEEKRAIDPFTRIVLKIRKLIERVPFGQSSIFKYAVMLQMLKEEVEKTDSDFQPIMDKFAQFISENMTTSAIDIADKPMDFSSHKTFAGKIVFDVDQDTYHSMRFGKTKQGRYKTHFDETVGPKIKEYVSRFPKKGVLLQNSKTGAMIVYREDKEKK